MSTINTNFNRRPYFDDWDPSKGYQRILFRPLTVQTRELNQLQTMLQDQMAQIGDHLFTEGSMVIPGGLSVSNLPVSMRFTMAGGSEISDIEFVEELYMVGKSSGVRARVIELARYTEAEVMTCVIEITSTGTNGSVNTFSPDDELYFNTFDANGDEIRIAYGIVNVVGGAIVARLSTGVYYVRGLMTRVNAQTLIVDPNNDDTDHKIGFQVTENIITELEDPSLYSNAQGEPNSKAPGAHRLQVELKLARVDLDSTDQNFIELARVKGGVLQSLTTQTTYNILDDTLAQRTYEESGDYNVSPHTLDLRENLNNGTNGGVYTADQGGDATKLVAILKPGVSYVRGHRVENIGEILVNFDKSRDTAILNNSVAASSTGGYFLTTGSKGVPQINKSIRYKLLNAAGVSQGTCQIIAAARSGTEFRLYARDLRYTGDRNTVTKISYELSGVTMFSAGLTSNTLTQSSLLDLIFELPVSGVKSIAPAGSSDTSYTVMKSYTVQLDASGVGSLSAPGGYTFSPEFALYAGAKADGSAAQVSIDGKLALTGTPVGSALSVNMTSGYANTQISLMCVMVRTSGSYKSKTVTEVTESRTFANASSVTLTNQDGWKLISVTDANGVDVTSSFTFDGGQRDAGYYPPTLTSTTGAITGVYSVKYSFLAHGAGDYFSVDSYSSIGYDSIPTYTSSAGYTYYLTDCLDFRGRVDASGIFDTDVVRPETTIMADLEYYLPRMDSVYVSDKGVFGVARGVSSNTIVEPSIPDNSMRLYNLIIPPYTFSVNDLQTQTIDNRRYTMRDIGKLEQRISNVEYYTSLSQLETTALNTQVYDPATGNPRYKNGIAADPFKDYRLINDLDSDWLGSIDPDAGRLRPFVMQNAIDMTSAWTPNFDDIISCAYTESYSVRQPLATSTMNVNPYAVFSWIGFLTLSPSTDYWYENYYIAPRIINETVDTRGAVQAGTVYGTWKQQSSNTVRTSTGSWTWKQVTTTVSVRSVTVTQYTESTSTTYAGEQVVETQIIPYMRTIAITFKATGMRPNTRLYPFFSSRGVGPYCAPAGGAQGQNLVTDGIGNLTGVFYVPSNSAMKFNTGDNVFRLSDNAANSTDPNTSFTWAEAVHKSFGTRQGIQQTYITTRTLGYTQYSTSETTSTSTTTTGGTAPVVKPVVRASTGGSSRDPIAQSFTPSTPSGEYVMGFNVYMATKSRDVPLTLELREMSSGVPSGNVISRKTLTPDQVNVSTNSATPTRFILDYPIFLSGSNEYAIVLLANTQDYNAWIAEMGKVDKLTGVAIAKQPYTGVFFSSSNGSTWTEHQMIDMKFDVIRQQFTTAVNQPVFSGKTAPKIRPLTSSPVTVTSGNVTVSVYCPGHGLIAGNSVTLSGLTGGCGIPDTDLNKTLTVISASYSTFSVAVATTPDSSGTIGGLDGSYLGNYLISMFYSNITNVALDGTSLVFEYRYKDASSAVMSDWIAFEAGTDVMLPTEGIYRATTDFQIRATMKRSELNNFLAPQIDLQGMMVVLNSFVVDPFETVFRAPTKDIMFDSACTSVRMFYSALLPSQSTMVVQIKPISSGQTSDDVANWITISPTKSIVNDGGNFFEYEYDYSTLSTTPFTGLKVRLSVTGSRVAPPSFKDFRLIALA